MESNPPSRFLREIDPAFLNRPLPESTGSSGSRNQPSGQWDNSAWGNGNTWKSRRDSYYSQQSGGRKAVADKDAPPAVKIPEGFRSVKSATRAAASVPATRAASSVPATSSDKDFKAANPSTLAVGMVVEHDRFGRGRILSLEGEMPNAKAVIDFEFGGAKTLLLKFAKFRS